MQEEHRFRLVGEGFNGASDHVRWVQRGGQWYQETWIGYEFEDEHVQQWVANNSLAGGPQFQFGQNAWKPIDIKDIYQLQVENPRLPLYLPTPDGGRFDIPADRPFMSQGK
ncbi:hypothetical protein [Mycobacterium sp.]|uniref:hypothetical protein n=1 Tax=Mycobacterium sp. TaxID=1785 RepID=UPI003BAD43EC